MLRVSSGHAASPAFPGAVAVRPRASKPAPVVLPQQPQTIAVRGHVRNGSAAALIVEPGGICLVSADRSRRRRVRRFRINEVLAVEEHRMARSTELVIVTATTAISVADVDIAQAWTFCRELRQLILNSARAGRARIASRRTRES